MDKVTKSDESNEIDIRCPNCDSDRVVVCEDSHGHFQVVQCYDCGFTAECDIEDKEKE